MLNRKNLSCLLVVLMLLALLCGCGTEISETTAVTSSDTTVESTTAAPEVPAQISIVENGQAVFKLIRDEDAASSGAEVAQARIIMNQIKDSTGATMALGTDWVKRGQELDSTTYE